MRKALAIGAVVGGYTMLLGVLVVLVVAVTSAIVDGWKLRQAAEKHADSSPRFSPDGTQIAFLRGGAGASELWVMDVDGTDPRPLAAAARFVWARRGDALLFSHGGSRVFRVGAGGGEPAAAGRELLPAPAAADRKGRKLVFARDHRIYIRAPDGSVSELT